MNKKDTKDYFIFTYVKLKKNNWYIKGYGEKLDRLMTNDHPPYMNIPKIIKECLLKNKLIKREDLVFIFSQKSVENEELEFMFDSFYKLNKLNKKPVV